MMNLERRESKLAEQQRADPTETRPQFVVKVKQPDGSIVEKTMSCERTALINKRLRITK